MKRTIKTFAVALLSISLLAGCSSQSVENNSSGDVNSISISHEKGITDVPVNPSKVAVFDMAALDTMDTLGVETSLSLPISSLPTYLSHYGDSASAGNMKEPNIEALYEFAPELIILSNRQADFYDQLSEIAPTILLRADQSRYMEDVEKNIMSIASIFEKTQEAEELFAQLEDKIQEVSSAGSSLDSNALILLTNDGKISAYGSGSRFGMIHDVLGIKAADSQIEVSTHGQEVGYEYISKINPDSILVVDRTTIGGGTNYASDTLANPLVESTNAAKNNQIHYLDAERWYLSSEGLSSLGFMVDEISNIMVK